MRVRVQKMPMIYENLDFIWDTYVFWNVILKFENEHSQKQSTVHDFKKKLPRNTQKECCEGTIKKLQQYVHDELEDSKFSRSKINIYRNEYFHYCQYRIVKKIQPKMRCYLEYYRWVSFRSSNKCTMDLYFGGIHNGCGASK